MPLPSRDFDYDSKKCIEDVLRTYENGTFVLLEAKDRIYPGVKQDITTFNDVVLAWIVRVIPPLDLNLAKYIEDNKKVRKYHVEESIDFRRSNHAYVSLHDGVLRRLTDEQSTHLVRHLPF